MPLRSLKRSSPCGALTAGAAVVAATVVAAATEVAGGTEVSDDELPHNSRTADETGWVRSPAWNRERNTGSVGDEVSVVVAEAILTGVTVRLSGKLDR